ncbi:MAG: DUF4115 domain-containing protein [Hydrogenophaga sp.]|nr:DUF4115 domain-containing protein [Hydrogenophaga sp.]
MINEENNEELRPPESQSSDETVVDEQVSDEPSEPDVAAPASDEPTGPGQLLSRKREALGMTVQQVADELHITMHYVRALESNAHDKLPGDVFIRGYIRSYANMLKLDPVVLVNVYNEFTNQQASAAEEASGSRARRRKDKNLPWIIVSGIAFVGIAVALWYFNSRPTVTSTGSVQGVRSPAPAQVVVPAPALSDGSAPTIDNVATTLATDVVAPSVVAPGSDVSPSLAAAVVEAVAEPALSAVTSIVEPVDVPVAATPPTAVQETAVQNALVLDAEVLEVNTSAQLSESDVGAQSVEDATPASPAAAQEVTPDAVPGVVPGVVPEVAPEPARESIDASLPPPSELRIINVDAGGEDLVQITFNGESMVQVEDGNDQQIYRDIRTSGDVLRITGSAPFNILLGDAASTELSLNGNNIDFTSNIRIDNSVRLTIGL